jgi:hypothetical protein
MNRPEVGQLVYFTPDGDTGKILDVFDVTDTSLGFNLEIGVNVLVLWDENVGPYASNHLYTESMFKPYSTEQELLVIKLKYPVKYT